MALKSGDVVTNKEIAELFLCSNQGGIRKSNRTKSVIVIAKFIECSYNHKKDGDILRFVGMGKKGDQELKRGNKALAEAKEIGYKIHLFEMYVEGEYTYCGEVGIVGELDREEEVDESGEVRSVIVFPLRVK